MVTFYRVLTCSFILLHSIWIITSQHELDYSDIEAIGASCYPKDTCNKPRRLPFLNRTCECDAKCHQFNDCCIDIPTNPPPDTSNLNPNIECYAMKLHWGVYAITKCPTNYQGDPEIRSKCESEKDLSDPLSAVLATDISTNITYKNRFCAHCNNAQPHSLRSWDILIECPNKILNISNVTPTYVEEQLTLINSDDENIWGFYYPEETSSVHGERQFYPCDVPFKLPDSLRKNVRLCRPNLISTCAADWNRPLVANKCLSYTAVIYVAPNFYKNPHCILCNNLEVSQGSCNIPHGIISRDKKPAMSFTLLMDVNMSDGNKVGEVQDTRCTRNQQWDPFSKRCRNTVCAIPGYRVRNGECVRP